MKNEVVRISSLSARWLLARVLRFDLLLLAIVMCLVTVGFITLFSAGHSFPWRIEDQLRNIIIASVAMFVVSLVPVKWFERISLPCFILGCVLLAATAVAGVTVKGATRWLNIGVRIQPSEIMKLAVPMMLAWYYWKRSESLRWWDHFAALGLLLIPVAFILKQPDLGTAILVSIAGLSVIFFAGVSIRIVLGCLAALILALPFLWTLLHDYQRERVMTLLDPTLDPLGQGFHILQALIAIGSGGFKGKGWMEGTQAHLDFIPERTSDFIFAVFGEEFGFVGATLLLAAYLALISRSFIIAAYAPTRYSRLLASAIGVIFFTYTFVNIGMVSGILPVVGVPLPFMSYGGTALLILGVCTGILLAISAESKD
ncbi:rod shape-determining protein RodA [Sutterella sp.]|uniref:rod shape-determining protein RodA n=1 Tax=Sutterella sp. TaxID=1981025 RepID=UPI0026DF9503|nr:rod shape-determining protein RodA [Sutterella sp.]MDO5530415.1 rod shape-determining protein RodA [Sutterella sp.]